MNRIQPNTNTAACLNTSTTQNPVATGITASRFIAPAPTASSRTTRKRKLAEIAISAVPDQPQPLPLAKLLQTQKTSPDEQEQVNAAYRKCSGQLKKLRFCNSDMEGYDLVCTLQQQLNTEPVNKPEIWEGINLLMEYVVNNVRLYPGNQQVLIYFIEQGFQLIGSGTNKKQDEWPERVLPLPLKTMKALVANYKPGIPPPYCLKAILNAPEDGFSILAAELLPEMTPSLAIALIAPALRTTSTETLEVIYSYLEQQTTTTSSFQEGLNRAIKLRHFLYPFPDPYLLRLLTLERMSLENRQTAVEWLHRLNRQEQLSIAQGCILGGLQNCSRLLKEIGIQLTPNVFIEGTLWNMKHSFLSLSKACGLSSNRKFSETILECAPFLWQEQDVIGYLPWQPIFQGNFRSWFSELEFLSLVIQQLSRHNPLLVQISQDLAKAPVHEDVHLKLWIHRLFSFPPGGKASFTWHHPVNQPGTLEHTLINAVDQHNNLARPEDFIRFMDWFLMNGLSIIRQLPDNQDMEKCIPVAAKNSRPDLWPDIADHPERRQTVKPLETYIYGTIERHYLLLETFLRAAPPSHRDKALNHWLTSPDCQAHRAKLFGRLLHPMNTFRELYPWYLFLTLNQSYSFPDNQLSGEWPASTQVKEATPAPEEIRQLLRSTTEVAGRTLRVRSDHGWDYLKFLSDTETPQDLLKEGEKLRLLRKRKSDLGLRSCIPEVIGFSQWDGLEEGLEQMPKEKKARLEQKCRYDESGGSYCLHLKTGKDEPYHLYPYDLDPETSAEGIIDGLCTYAHDYGQLFSQGLLGSALLAAYHDENTNRKHYILAPYAGFSNEGLLSRWLDTTRHPNAGPVGMRDMGDTKTPEETGEDYFFSLRAPITLDLDDPRDKSRLAFNELAKSAQGLVLQYARCFRQNFNYQDDVSTKIHEQNIQKLMSTLFNNAFPKLGKTAIQQAMAEDDLSAQATREVIYWCAQDAPFVGHLLNGHIPPETYPDFPPGTRVKELSDKERGQLIPGKGFVTEEPFINLGENNGVNPLIKLNALIVKLLALGTLSAI